MPQSLAELLQAVDPTQIVDIQGDLGRTLQATIVEDIDQLQAGGAFIARQGAQFDGHDFIHLALERGASAIFGEKEIPAIPVPYIRLSNLQQQIGLLSAAYHGVPARQLTLFGVTGTDGKTTTSHMLYQILKQKYPRKVGLVSTLMAFCGEQGEETGLHVTSPPAPQLQAYLARMVANGLTHAVLEMTSHGLAQGRLQGVELAAAVITNIQHEHLDYHGSWEDYRRAKGRIFTYLKSPHGFRVLNADDEASQLFRIEPFHTFGSAESAHYRVQRSHETSSGIEVQLKTPETTMEIHSPLAGRYNAANVAAAVAAADPFMEGDGQLVIWGIAELRSLPGRMEAIEEGQEYRAYVDFAHTPAALKEALNSAKRKLTGEERLCVVFGSAGLRDVAKRKMMARIASELSDYAVLTAEDPRTESLQDILRDMASACQEQGGVEGVDFVRIPDRGLALLHACQWARTDDMVIACGKGHEQSMCFGTTEYPWDDRMALRSAIRGISIQNLPTAN
ncbi:MAG: UDP-N-acetylmuramoyl-L-alanyl-D-glutamate--2,6-diaminopimelate ligase [Anaerolineaceae bacterium]|nr:UDP-N-acetylmuramoyl-L-alanyl-D-glutamate--2,6-diaminopimelate ligase [Anaerolineaceae bacterium]